jgi:hypothetical protein
MPLTQSTGLPRKERVQRNGMACGKKLCFATWYLLGAQKPPAIKHKSPSRSGDTIFHLPDRHLPLHLQEAARARLCGAPATGPPPRADLRRPDRCRRGWCGRGWRLHSSGAQGAVNHHPQLRLGNRAVDALAIDKEGGYSINASDSASFIEARTWLSSCRARQASRRAASSLPSVACWRAMRFRAS